MIENLEKWLHINSIEDKSLLEAWKLIINTNKEPVILSSRAYILKYFYDLLQNKISLEDFYMIWDMYSNINTEIESFITNPYDFLNYIKDKKESDNKIYIIDDYFKWVLKKDRQDILYI